MTQGTAYRAALQYLTRNLPDDRTPPTMRWRGQFYQKSGSCYRPVSDEAIEAAFVRWAARSPVARTGEKGRIETLSKSFAVNGILAIRAETQVPDSVTPGAWLRNRPEGALGPFLGVQNGILDLGPLPGAGPALLADSPDFFSLNALPVSFEPDAQCPRWRAFLDETFSADGPAIDLLQEVFGYCLLPSCPFEKFVIFFGDANTGKSTVAEVLQALLGPDNVSALTLERLGERFALTSLVGKLANVVFDTSEIERTAEGTLKALASGEPVTVELKHGPIRALRLTAKHVFVTNVLPRFHDTTNGLWRRLVLLPFQRVCPEAARDPGLKARLLTELPGIATWALQGLARLLGRGGFSAFEAGTRLAAEYRQESNPVAMFLASECEAAVEARVSRRALYQRYRAWVEENHHAPQSATRFYREVRAICPQPAADVRDGRGGDRLFVGLRLRGDDDVLERFRALEPARAEGV
jgi:putative DNA primase/helicase